MTHRTQLILEEWQYDGIRSIAESAGTSISSVVREAVSEYLAERRGAKALSLDDLKGLAHDPGLSGRDHDAALYGAPQQEPVEPSRPRKTSR